MADAREQPFQQDIVDALSANGWLVGDPTVYDRERSLDPEALIGYSGEVRWEPWQRCRVWDQHDIRFVLGGRAYPNVWNAPSGMGGCHGC